MKERKFYTKKQMPQRTQEWFVARMAKFTSSNVSKLFASPTKAEIEAGETFSKGAKDFINDKAWELIFPNPEISPQTPAMQRGEEFEPQAIKRYLERFKNLEAADVSFAELGFYDEKGKWKSDTASSPDKIVVDRNLEQKGGVEIKCRGQKQFGRAVRNLKEANDLLKHKTHKSAFYQCHHQIWVCGLDWVDYVHYHPDIDEVYDPIKNERVASAYQHKCLHVVRIHRDETIIKQFEKVIPLAAQLRDHYLKEILK